MSQDARKRMALPQMELWWKYFKAGLLPFVILIIFSIALLGIGLAIRGAVRAAHELTARYARSGTQIRGKVVRARTKLEGPPGKKVPHHHVEYEFADSGGVARRGSSLVTEAQLKGLKRGGPITVEYLRDQPDVSRVVGPKVSSPPPAWLGSGLIGAGAVVCLLNAAGLGYQSLKAHRRAKVVREGLAYQGWVDEIDEHPQTGGSPRFVLSFKFQDGDGETNDGWIWLPKDLRERWQPGAPIVVLWDGNATSYPEPDIFEFRREEFKGVPGSAATGSRRRGRRPRRTHET